MRIVPFLLGLALLGGCSAPQNDREGSSISIPPQSTEPLPDETPISTETDPTISQTLLEPVPDIPAPPIPGTYTETPPKKWLPTQLDDLSLPEAITPFPSEKEWLDAKLLHTTDAGCWARVVREWMTILCPMIYGVGTYPTDVVRVVTGDAKEVRVWSWISAPRAYANGMQDQVVAAAFPIRRGDRRLMEIGLFRSGAKPIFNHVGAITISEIWLEGMKSPEISVTH